jgi:fumarate reductase subunit C
VSPRAQLQLWVAQRIGAAVLALCVIVHLATMIYAVRHGLSATAILDRTRGNWGWAGFYLLFVLAVSVHAPIGMRTICGEWLGLSGRAVDVVLAALGVALAAVGLRAVWAVFAS